MHEAPVQKTIDDRSISIFRFDQPPRLKQIVHNLETNATGRQPRWRRGTRFISIATKRN
jgi:hypothetical protein